MPRWKISRWLVVGGLTLWVMFLVGVVWLVLRGGCGGSGPCAVVHSRPSPSFLDPAKPPAPRSDLTPPPC